MCRLFSVCLPQGILSCDARSMTSVPSYARLWVHENRRVFADRLINDQDREWFDALLARLMESHLKLQMPEVIPEGQRVLFGDFMSGGGDQRQYEEIPDAQAVMRTINDFLSDYNEQVRRRLPLLRSGFHITMTLRHLYLIRA
jgi:dynein heavy chain